MAIITNLDVMLAKRKMSSKELAETIGITIQNLSCSENRQSQGHPVFDPGGNLQNPSVSAG